MKRRYSYAKKDVFTKKATRQNKNKLSRVRGNWNRFARHRRRYRHRHRPLRLAVIAATIASTAGVTAIINRHGGCRRRRWCRCGRRRDVFFGTLTKIQINGIYIIQLVNK
jgi:hypothetical protein